MARAGLSDIRDELRGMTAAGTADWTQGTALTYFSDEMLDDILDRHSYTFTYEQMEAEEYGHKASRLVGGCFLQCYSKGNSTMGRSLLQAGLGRRREGRRLDSGNGKAAGEIVALGFSRIALGNHEWYSVKCPVVALAIVKRRQGVWSLDACFIFVSAVVFIFMIVVFN